ncbi:MAG: prenyltransferase/squalene oxidase repeat-containing protein [Planctomycetota bacterium]
MAPKHPATDPNAKWRTEGVAPPKADALPGPMPIDGRNPAKVGGAGGRQAARRRASPVAPRDLEVAADGSTPKTMRGPAWMLSAAAHLIVLILLATLTYRIQSGNDGIRIDGSVKDSSPDSVVQILTIDPTPIQNESAAAALDLLNASDATATLPTELPNVAPDVQSSDSAVLENAIGELIAGGGKPSKQMIFLGGGSMASRLPEARVANAAKYGATAESEQAVERALRWLAAHQRGDGSWSFDLSLAPCEGRCRHGKPADGDTPTPSTAATGLALLAFLGAGYTDQVGPYKETVSKGIYYLKSVAAETQFGYDWQQGGSMYGHGIALLALTEAMQMTKLQGQYDTDLMRYVQSGALFTTVAQHDSGSWGYIPGSPGDTTITGWQTLSLLGAKKSGVQMQSGVFKRVIGFLDSVRDGSNFEFGYRSRDPEPTTTAIALFLLLHLRNQSGMTYFDRAFDKIVKEGPTLTNVYHDYYATMALHHIRHRDWDRWNTRLRDHLVQTQAREGHEDGSWHFQDRWGNVGGRVYTTAMCTLTLEVYYRYLPLYELPEQFPL